MDSGDLKIVKERMKLGSEKSRRGDPVEKAEGVQGQRLVASQ